MPSAYLVQVMAAKIVSAIVTLFVTVTTAALMFIMLLIALNGFHESDANYGIASYLILALAGTVAMSAAAFFTAGVLINRKFSSLVSSLVAITVFSLAGVLMMTVFVGIGALFAELARTNL